VIHVVPRAHLEDVEELGGELALQAVRGERAERDPS
jgi:hypothetical protein